jgi:hypothetical protein
VFSIFIDYLPEQYYFKYDMAYQHQKDFAENQDLLIYLIEFGHNNIS